jgi:septal ring factor EnvC (AmiA/AmiB activator)
LLLLLWLLVFPPVYSRAQDDPALQRDLQVIKRQIRREKQCTRRARRRQESLLQELDILNRRRSTITQELGDLDREIDKVGEDVAERERKTAQLEKEYQALQQKYCRRLRIRYCQPPGRWFDFFGREPDLTARINFVEYGLRVLAADRRLQDDCATLLTEVKNHRQELEKRREFLLELKRRQESKASELEESIAKKNELLYRIQHQVASQQKLIAELEKTADKLGRMTRQQPTPTTGFANLKGRLPMPVNGLVISFFGIERDDDYATVTRNKGIEIEAPAGTPVRVVHAGKVVFASWLKGYGNLLVVDHGSGYFSVYAHLQDFACKVGAVLVNRQVIGRVGVGMFTDGPSLYFEIRKDGVPEDPLTWVSQLEEQAG